MRLSRKTLYNTARPVEFGSAGRNLRLAQDMLQLMRRSAGIGLAAPQCGVSRRVFVMEIQGWQRHCFNPEITNSSEQRVHQAEGCLSFPGDQCTLTRPSWIDVRYQDHRAGWHAERLDGIFSRCFQHELDHLDGITMWQRHKEQNAEPPRD